MARLCERPGCSVPADVSYGFDAEHLVVWLDGFHAAPGPTSGVLCRRHADAMVVPLGWMLDDRRDPAPRLFRSPSGPPTGPMIRPRIKRVRPDPATATVQLELPADAGTTTVMAADDRATAALDQVVPPVSDEHADDEWHDEIQVKLEPADEHLADEAEPVADVPGPDGPEVLPWQPVFDQRDDLHGLLKAKGRLLSRAFTASAPTTDRRVDVAASMHAPCARHVLFAHVDELTDYPAWMPLAHRVAPLAAEPDGRPVWDVELRARVGPFARSKRLRMVRTVHEPDSGRVRFERVEHDGRSHSSWVLDATVVAKDEGSRLDMQLHYGGALWTGGIMERVLADQITSGRERLLAILSR